MKEEQRRTPGSVDAITALGSRKPRPLIVKRPHKVTAFTGDTVINLPSRHHGENALPFGLSVLISLALATIAGVGLYQIRDMFGPVFFALTLVLTVRPIHRWLVRKGLPLWLSAIITLTTLGVLLIGSLAVMVWALAPLPDVIADYVPKFQDWVQNGLAFAQAHGLSSDQLTQAITSKMDVSSALGYATTALASVSNVGTLIGMLVLSLVFITADTMSLRFRSALVESYDSTVYHALASFESRVRSYWIVSSVFGLIVAVFNAIGLYALHVPLPVAWAFFSFVTNYIPNVGFIIGVIPPALMGALNTGWLTGVWVIVMYSVINFVIQSLIQPKFTADAVGLSTTMTFVSLIFWTIVVGPLGSILAVPLTLFAKAILVDSSRSSRWLDAFLVSDSDTEKKIDSGYYGEAAVEAAENFDEDDEDFDDDDEDGGNDATRDDVVSDDTVLDDSAHDAGSTTDDDEKDGGH